MLCKCTASSPYLRSSPCSSPSQRRLKYMSADASSATWRLTFTLNLATVLTAESLTESLASLKSLFPNLESCVVMVHLGHNAGLALSRHINDQPGRQDFASACLAFRNVIKANNIITLEETLVRFIAAFLEGGPGKRKFVRFAHSNPQEPWLRIVGPLVRASRREPSGSLLRTEEPTSEEFEDNFDAESIFKEAYWGKTGPLGDWAASFRAQQVWYYTLSDLLGLKGGRRGLSATTALIGKVSGYAMCRHNLRYARQSRLLKKLWNCNRRCPQWT